MMEKAIQTMVSLVMTAAMSLFNTSVSYGGDHVITVPPAVFEYGADTYCVMWETSKKGSGYVKYTYNGEERILWDEVTGIARTHDTIHRVFVPREELRDNDYRVGSQYVGFKYAYDAIKGDTVESDVIHFGGVEKADDIRILSVSDIHEEEEKLYQAIGQLDYTPDLIILLGDMCSNLETKAKFAERVLGNAARLSGGAVPVVYVRGNHETRGEFASQLAEYIPSTTDGLYFTFDFGGLSAVVLDTGEDKPDSDEEYSGLVNFAGYREREWQWIHSLRAEDFTGKYKLVFSHIPDLRTFFDANWSNPFYDMGFDLIVGGHIHKVQMWNRNRVPIFADGGTTDRKRDGFLVSTIHLVDGTIGLTVTNTSGKVVFQETLEAH